FYAPMDRADFWAGLPPTPEKEPLMRLLAQRFEPDDVFILTAASGGKPERMAAAVSGKRQWLQAHLPGYGERLIVVPHASVKERLAGPHALLIDDNGPTIAGFAEAGGMGVLVPRPWNHLFGYADHPLDWVRLALHWLSSET